MSQGNDIFFFRPYGNNGCFSNFYNKSDGHFTVDRIVYNCNEKWFMFHKCLLFDSQNEDLKNQILSESKPFFIKKLGWKVNNFVQDVWEEKKYQIMVNGLLHKFGQNPNLKKVLLDTGNKTLYEASPCDKIWGIGYSVENAPFVTKSSYGNNLLGKALMEVRSQFQNQS